MVNDDDEIFCDSCGECIDVDDEVESQFAIVDFDAEEHLCALCNSD